MRLDRFILHRGLKELVRATRRWPAKPPHDHLHLHARDGVLRVAALGQETTATYEMPAEGELALALPARALNDIIKPSKAYAVREVTIERVAEESAYVRAGPKEKLLDLMPVHELPQRTDWSPLARWPALALEEALTYVLRAASKDMTRPCLTNVLFDKDQMVATDGHRLQVAPMPGRIPDSMLVPTAATEIVKRVLGYDREVDVKREGEALRFLIGPWQITCQLSDTTFPPYQSIMLARGSLPVTVAVESHALRAALKELRGRRRAKELAIMVRVGHELLLSFHDPDPEVEVIRASVPLSHAEPRGGELEIGLNLVYLLEATDGAKGLVELGFSDSFGPVRVDLEDDRFALIMPIRL